MSLFTKYKKFGLNKNYIIFVKFDPIFSVKLF